MHTLVGLGSAALKDTCTHGIENNYKVVLNRKNTHRVILLCVVLHLFVRSYVSVSKAKFAENVHFILSSIVLNLNSVHFNLVCFEMSVLFGWAGPFRFENRKQR